MRPLSPGGRSLAALDPADRLGHGAPATKRMKRDLRCRQDRVAPRRNPVAERGYTSKLVSGGSGLTGITERTADLRPAVQVLHFRQGGVPWTNRVTCSANCSAAPRRP